MWLSSMDCSMKMNTATSCRKLSKGGDFLSLAWRSRRMSFWLSPTFDEREGIWCARQPQRHLVKQNSADVGNEEVSRHRLNRRSRLHSQVHSLNFSLLFCAATQRTHLNQKVTAWLSWLPEHDLVLSNWKARC